MITKQFFILDRNYVFEVYAVGGVGYMLILWTALRLSEDLNQ